MRHCVLVPVARCGVKHSWPIQATISEAQRFANHVATPRDTFRGCIRRAVLSRPCKSSPLLRFCSEPATTHKKQSALLSTTSAPSASGTPCNRARGTEEEFFVSFPTTGAGRSPSNNANRYTLDRPRWFGDGQALNLSFYLCRETKTLSVGVRRYTIRGECQSVSC